LIFIISLTCSNTVALSKSKTKPNNPETSQSILAVESRARGYVALMGLAQQLSFVENGKFTTKIDPNTTNIPKNDPNYRFIIKVISPKKLVQNQAIPRNAGFHTYLSIAYYFVEPQSDRQTVDLIFCASNSSEKMKPELSKFVGLRAECPPGFTKFKPDN
jgi:Type IV pilin-like G and H, putative